MTTTTRQTSLARFTDALREHGWTYTVEAAAVRVPDKTRDESPSWSRKVSHPRIEVAGFVVTFDNGRPDTSGNSISNNISARAYFTEAGAYVAEMTPAGPYPIQEKMPVKDLVKIIANKAPARVLDSAERIKAERKARHETAVAEAQEAAAQAQQAAIDAGEVAVTAVMDHVPGIDRDEARRILSALEADERITAARAARHDLQVKAQATERAINEMSYSRKNGWSY